MKMAFLDWIKRRKELSALSGKYGHDAIGAPGASKRHHEMLADLREAKPQQKPDNRETRPRPRPSWDR